MDPLWEPGYRVNLRLKEVALQMGPGHYCDCAPGTMGGCILGASAKCELSCRYALSPAGSYPSLPPTHLL